MHVAGAVRRPGEFRKAEVEDLHHAIARDPDVGGLQIAMDETNLVRLGQELYGDPFVNAAMTFIEPFPIGLIITLISAVVLRRKPRAPSSPSASPASS